MGRHHAKKELADALEATHGKVYLAAEKLAMSPTGLYARIRKDVDLQAIVDLYDGRLTDAAELKLEQAIVAGEPWAIALQLKTKGKSRGYTEKLEVQQSGRLTVELEPKVGPELDRAIRRVLGAVADAGQRGAFAPGDQMPQGFRSPDLLGASSPKDRGSGVRP
jgi:Bacterial regulatory protein, Fis family